MKLTLAHALVLRRPWGLGLSAAMAIAAAGLIAPSDIAMARSQIVGSADKFAAAVAAARPGDEVLVAAGTYADWTMLVPATAGGEPGHPVRIAAEQPGAVTLTGDSLIDVSASHVEISGFRFEGTGAPSLRINGSHIRATGLEFQGAGNRRKPHAPILVIGTRATDNEIDNCLFVGSASVSLQVRMPTESGGGLPLRNSIHHNEFRDIPRYSGNGQEPIQVGQGPGGREMLGTSVEHNRFIRADGDDELVSVKTSGNRIRFNVAMDSEGGISLRGGDHNLVEGNVLVHTKRGIVIAGTGHVVVDNYVNDPSREGILLAIGSERYRAAIDTVVAHNTVINARRPLRFLLRDSVATESPRHNKIVNNILVAKRPGDKVVAANGPASLESYLSANDLTRNLLWWSRGTGDKAEAAVYRDRDNLVADPRLDLSEPLRPRLRPDSPALGSALPGFDAVDPASQSRGQDARLDIGALRIGGS